MTDSQLKYQTLMESQRHNLEMERLGQAELGVKERDVSAKEKDVAIRDYKKDAEVAKMLTEAGNVVSQQEARPWELAFKGVQAVGSILGAGMKALFA